MHQVLRCTRRALAQPTQHSCARRANHVQTPAPLAQAARVPLAVAPLTWYTATRATCTLAHLRVHHLTTTMSSGRKAHVMLFLHTLRHPHRSPHRQLQILQVCTAHTAQFTALFGAVPTRQHPHPHARPPTKAVISFALPLPQCTFTALPPTPTPTPRPKPSLCCRRRPPPSRSPPPCPPTACRSGAARTCG